MLGVEAESLGSQLAEYFGVKEGVLVRSVLENTPAQKAGIKAGDVITKVDGMAVTSPSELSGAVRSASAKENLFGGIDAGPQAADYQRDGGRRALGTLGAARPGGPQFHELVPDSGHGQSVNFEQQLALPAGAVPAAAAIFSGRLAPPRKP